ncbi:RING finger protein nhl-1 isoform X3 [Tetranychus urticae]|uniref:RING finger protein nhl-1 isoform X3 n=1 Tax=Tetranychus urticae TaxID=32264 RepID=UPI000D653338|nr:RING finger protein nhl-1 isoform X3 [Tetranychus urticae]
MATAWDKLEQLLTCAICLDRFRNPKMLPCQHSFCQEPCMEGLQDYARRQIKCPECRAEHRIPFQGIQTYPTNVTLQRFLELHQSITGEEPEPVPSMMERCGVCSEKSTVTKCSHCDKKVCPECKEAHIDILKREISRICHQVRRALNRLQDALSQTERSMERLNVNSVHIRDEIEEIVRRFVKDLKAQEDKMLKDLETYSQVESKNLAKLKDDLAIEYDFLKDNCDSVEKNIVDPEKNWNDAELCEVKYIFVKTLDFLRNFDADAADYTRGMKFLPSSELDTLRRNLVNFGELKLLTSEEANANVRASSPGLTGGSNSLSVPQQSMLMRSQSDHRLATQFARRDSRISDLTSQSRLNPGYSDSEKDPRDSNRATSPSNYSRARRDDASRLGRYGASDDARDSTSRNRFLRESDNYRSGWARTDDDSFTSGPQFKSRFMRERGAELSGFDEFDYDPNAYLSRSVRFEEPTTVPSSVPTPLVKVFDVPEAPRGCLSGIVKISDTAHYMERSHENEVRAKVEKERKEEESRSLPPPSSIPAYQSPQRPRPPSRQVSEDEIEKQKKMNQASAASSVTTNTNSSLTNNTTSTFNSSTTTPSTIGLTSTTAPVNSYGSSITASNTQSSDSIRPITRRIGTFRDDEDSRSSSTHRSTSDSNSSSTRRSDTNDLTSSLVDDADDDLGESNLSRLGRRRRGSLTGEDSKESVTSSGRSSQVSATPASSASTATSGLRSVRAPLAKNLPIAEEEEDRDRDIARKRGPKSSLVNPTASSLVYSSGHDGSDDDDDTSTPSAPTYRSRYAEANYGKEGRYQYRTRQQPKDREKSPTHDENSGNTGTTAWSQYLRNKYGSSRNSSASSTGSGSRAAGLSKSKSSHAVYSRNLSDSSDDEGNTNTSGPKALSRKGSLDATETSSSTDGRRPSYGYNLPRSTYLQKRRMMFKIGTRGTEPGCFTWPRGIACGPDNSIVVADSSNHRVQVFDSTGRFLHEFGSYGSAEGEFDCLAGVAVNRIGQYIVSDRYNHRVQIFDPSGRFLRSFGCEGRVDGRFSYPWGITTDSLGFIYVCDKENHRIQVFQSDGTFVGKFGSIGNRPGLLEHPHYIAVSNTNRVIVSDSNNHRIQIFDVNGRSLSTFGCEGTEEGQFKFPRGIAVDDQGYIIVGDSGNNRIQIFNPDGTFLKAFGSWGSSEGEFKGLEGVAVSTTGNILVCDRENHRIQVF